MPKFFLGHIHGNDRIPDLEGADFPNKEALTAEAVAAAREIMADRLLKGIDLDHSRFEVKDELGKTVMVLPFKGAIPNGQRSQPGDGHATSGES